MILDSILERAGEQSPEWLAKALARAPEAIERAPEDLRPALFAVAQALEAHRPTLERVAPATFAVVAARLAIGHEDEALVAWLCDLASFDDRLAARAAANAETLKAARDSAAFWSALKTAAREILRAGGQVAIPFLLALI